MTFKYLDLWYIGFFLYSCSRPCKILGVGLPKRMLTEQWSVPHWVIHDSTFTVASNPSVTVVKRDWQVSSFKSFGIVFVSTMYTSNLYIMYLQISHLVYLGRKPTPWGGMPLSVYIHIKSLNHIEPHCLTLRKFTLCVAFCWMPLLLALSKSLAKVRC